MSTTTTNMSLNKPDVSQTTGPTWATEVNANADLLDVHDHSTSKGVKITPSGMNINADLEFNDNDATEVRSLRFQSQAALLADAADLRCLFSFNGDFYYRNAAGASVRVTDGATLDAGTFGGITGMGGTTAAATYSDISKTFTLTQNTNVAAKLAAESVSVFAAGTSTQAVILQYLGTTAKTLTLPEFTAALAHLGNAAQTFTGATTFSNTATFTGATSSSSTATFTGPATFSNTSSFTGTATLTAPAFTGNPTGSITSGTYSATITALGNCTVTTPATLNYMRVGTIVLVSGRISVDVTTTLANAACTVSLPVASSFASAGQASGTAMGSTDATTHFSITGSGSVLYLDQNGQVQVSNAAYELIAMYLIV